MTDPVSISNQALLMLGDKTIASMTENTKEAQVANSFYTDARNHCLRDVKPSFAIQRVVPGAQLAIIDPNLPFTYLLPTNCGVVLGTYVEENYPGAIWHVESGKIMSQIGLTQITFVTLDPALETSFDSSFIKALVAYLASEFAYALTGSAPKSEEMTKLYQYRKDAAQVVYGQESATRMTYNTQLEEGRG